MSLHASLHSTLSALSANPAPSLPSPPTTPKRASVALIFRINPHPSHPPTLTPTSSLDTFFELPWVQHGTPEILFIKRSSRIGDRWTAHVALPGGKRDPTDPSDLAAAIRETQEEVNLDISEAIHCGKLPDRILKTAWGTNPLMVLSPHLFLLTTPTPPLTAQPTEVASAHWVPLRSLLNPRYRCTHAVDLTTRLSRKSSGALRFLLWLSVGELRFPGIRLWPSESVFSTYTEEFEAPRGDLVMWGVTLLAVGDLLDCLPGGGEWWGWPSFTAWDVKAWVWGLSRGLRERNWRVAEREGVKAWIGGKGEGRCTGDVLLEEYWAVVGMAAWVAVAVRVAVVVGVAAWWWS